jgi:putative hydrolase of the HAD superfamily
VLGYDALFDVSCYSWELGARKPHPAFFAEAVRRVGANPAAILFIDDSALLGLLARHGVASA